ncbi:hypothetical protein BJX66DRAFT_315296 [Aspergillus keveii]|uniref:Uncharacterized protein n=1 Tax=Aspergillus keveii TaxID=714993 RepID=A0ABR4FQD0_9EURO
MLTSSRRLAFPDNQIYIFTHRKFPTKSKTIKICRKSKGCKRLQHESRVIYPRRIPRGANFCRRLQASGLSTVFTGIAQLLRKFRVCKECGVGLKVEYY